MIPETFICVHIGRPVPEDYRQTLAAHFPKAELVEADESRFSPDELPPTIRDALRLGHTAYVEEYYALKILEARGGIVLKPEMRPNIQLKRCRLERIFFGFENEEELNADCFGAIREHYVIQALLATYETDNIFNKAFLPLKERLRDFLVLHFRLKVNGRKQLLKKEIPVYLPSVLAYDMKDGENCCKRAVYPVPEGYELVSGSVLKMWSDRLLENWNLYKQEAGRKPGGKPDACPAGAGIRRHIAAGAGPADSGGGGQLRKFHQLEGYEATAGNGRMVQTIKRRNPPEKYRRLERKRVYAYDCGNPGTV